jgi:hypothetical protein
MLVSEVRGNPNTKAKGTPALTADVSTLLLFVFMKFSTISENRDFKRNAILYYVD